MLLADLPADLPLLLLATADSPQSELDSSASALFGNAGQGTVFELERPTNAERAAMFDGLFSQIFHPAKQKAAKIAKSPPPQVPNKPILAYCLLFNFAHQGIANFLESRNKLKKYPGASIKESSVQPSVTLCACNAIDVLRDTMN